MKCPYCGYEEQRVLDSRPAREGDSIRRRRECVQCERRFTTFEEPERPRLFVVKRSGARQEFSREKVLQSMLLACHKRAVTMDALRGLAEDIERELFQQFDEEITSKCVGDIVLAKLKEVDTVAFIRFASVYQEFQTVGDFLEVIETVGRRAQRQKALVK